MEKKERIRMEKKEGNVKINREELKELTDSIL